VGTGSDSPAGIERRNVTDANADSSIGDKGRGVTDTSLETLSSNRGSDVTDTNLESSTGNKDRGVTDTEPEQLVRANIAWMLALAERLLRDRALAEDVVQESFIRAFRGLATFEGRSSLESWLHRITTNTALSKLRQLNRLAEQPIDEYLPEFDQHDCRVEAPWPALATVDDIVENEDLRRRVYAGIGELPDAYRMVLQLRDIEGYATAEVAKLLEISESNVKVRLHRARSALKKLLEPILRGEMQNRIPDEVK